MLEYHLNLRFAHELTYGNYWLHPGLGCFKRIGVVGVMRQIEASELGPEQVRAFLEGVSRVLKQK